VDALLQVDPGFTKLCKTLLGDAADPQDVWEFMYGFERVVKMSPDVSDLATKTGKLARKHKGKLILTGGAGVSVGTGLAASKGRRYHSDDPDPTKRELTKADDGSEILWMGEFSKVDDDKHQVFGWASIVEIDGEPVIDRQGDFMELEDIEKAAYEYVMKSRKGGHQHKRTEDDQPFQASDMIESIVFTDEKVSKMGLPDDFPRGWWVGYKVRDGETWEKIKKGEVTGFSIHGRGKRLPMDAMAGAW
jgi:hypothetical protein